MVSLAGLGSWPTSGRVEKFCNQVIQEAEQLVVLPEVVMVY